MIGDPIKRPDATPGPEPEQKSHEQVAAELQGLAEMAALEARLARAVERFGKRMFVGMTVREAYTVMAECLEDGASAIEAVRNGAPAPAGRESKRLFGLKRSKQPGK